MYAHIIKILSYKIYVGSWQADDNQMFCYMDVIIFIRLHEDWFLWEKWLNPTLLSWFWKYFYSTTALCFILTAYFIGI